MERTELTGKILGYAMKVHRALGSGFLESVYHQALLIELNKNGLMVQREKKLPVYYEGQSVGEFVADMIVSEEVILELKAVEHLALIHEVQLVNYLTATGLDIGLLINFGAKKLEFKRKHRTLIKTIPENPVHPVEIT